MLKLVKLNADYGTTLNMSNKGVRKVVRIPLKYWELRAALFPYSLDGEFAVVVELARGGNRDFIKCNKEGLIELGRPYECPTFVLLWNFKCGFDDSQDFSMYQSSHSTLAYLVFPHHFKLDDNPNKLDFKHAYGIPTSEFVNMQHMRIDTLRQKLERSDISWAYRTQEPTSPEWRYYPFFTPDGIVMYKAIITRGLTATEVKNHLHGGYPGIVKVPLVKDTIPMESDYLYCCATLNQVKRLYASAN